MAQGVGDLADLVGQRGGAGDFEAGLLQQLCDGRAGSIDLRAGRAAIADGEHGCAHVFAERAWLKRAWLDCAWPACASLDRASLDRASPDRAAFVLVITPLSLKERPACGVAALHLTR